MNFQTKEGYRLNVAMIIFNEDKKVLFVEERIRRIGNFPKEV